MINPPVSVLHCNPSQAFITVILSKVTQLLKYSSTQLLTVPTLTLGPALGSTLSAADLLWNLQRARRTPPTHTSAAGSTRQ